MESRQRIFAQKQKGLPLQTVVTQILESAIDPIDRQRLSPRSKAVFARLPTIKTRLLEARLTPFTLEAFWWLEFWRRDPFRLVLTTDSLGGFFNICLSRQKQCHDAILLAQICLTKKHLFPQSLPEAMIEHS